MLKLDNEELDTNNYEIEIRKTNGYATEYKKELKKWFKLINGSH